MHLVHAALPVADLDRIDLSVEFLGRPPEAGLSDMDRLMTHVRTLSGRSDFADDFSIVEFGFVS